MHESLKNLKSAKEIQEFIAKCGSQRAAAKQLNVPRSTFQDHCKRIYKKEAEWELERERPTYAHKVLYQDIKRLERKVRRQKARDENAIYEVNKDILDFLSNYNFHQPRGVKLNCDTSFSSNNSVGVIQCSDWHIGECVNLNHNSYNLQVAAKRLSTFFIESLSLLKSKGVDTVVVALTGDLINSPRRPDEYLTNAKNSAKSFIVALDLLNQFIEEIATHFKKVIVVGVCGNESRLDKDWGNVQQVVSNNFDYMLLHGLHAMNRTDNVKFCLDQNPFETVMSINGANILVTHGTAIKHPESDVAKIFAKFAANDVKLNYAIFGHIHNAYVSDNFARSGSLVGDNTYSFNTLSLYGKPSQNCYIVTEQGTIDAYKINLNREMNYFDITNVLDQNENDKSGNIVFITEE